MNLKKKSDIFSLSFSLPGVIFSLSLLLICSCSDKKKEQAQQEKPDESYFSKIVLDENLDEPMELTVTPDGRVIFIERYGNVKLYHPGRQETILLARLEVNAVFSHGLQGITLDPNFEENNWLYLYYSPITRNKEVQRLSRFTLQDDKLMMASEQVILEVPVQREVHGHDGGSLAFGPDGNLFVAVGDNTSPFFPDSKTPLDERPGKEYFDAQRTSLNSNDLNGKILRIRPEAGGGYSIPRGNLFEEGKENTRPEIYVMGCRNPFRISVDQKTGFLYWGNIGGVDEVHQVQKPGLYGGWPYFYGNNQVYDLAKELKAEALSPETPVNNSPNNTGLKELPASQPAILWYSDDKFPLLGGMDGGKNIMAGPVYRSEMYADNPRKFPDYYDGKLFIYDWVRNWIIAVSFDKQHQYKEMEPFMPSAEFSRPMDMEFGPDGAMYLLEYGKSGYAQNPDARLVRIEFNEGNRAPIANFSSSRTAGAAPLQVRFSAKKSFDHDEEDELKFAWMFKASESAKIQSTLEEPQFTFEEPGVYVVELTVTDAQGAVSKSSSKIKVGNEPPVVDFRLKGNQSFYFDEVPLRYEVVVRDEEDGVLGAGIDRDEVYVSLDYNTPGHPGEEDFKLSGDRFVPVGRKMMESSDCMACHQTEEKSIGPSFKDISLRYASEQEAANRLSQKIINGGGEWEGGQVMPPHPQLSSEEAGKMVDYILSLGSSKKENKSLPLKGEIVFKDHLGQEEKGSYRLLVTYTDKGGAQAEPIKTEEIILLKKPLLAADDYEEAHQVAKRSMYVDKIRDGSYIGFKNIDLTGVRNISYEVSAAEAGGTIELRLGSPDGKLVSRAVVEAMDEKRDWRKELYAANQKWEEVEASVIESGGPHKLYFNFKNDNAEGQLFILNRIHFRQ